MAKGAKQRVRQDLGKVFINSFNTYVFSINCAQVTVLKGLEKKVLGKNTGFSFPEGDQPSDTELIQTRF